MALARIRRPEQLRHHPPGELGKTIGLDRVPEVRTLREKIAHIAATGNPTQWMRDLAKTWMENDPAEAGYLYIGRPHPRLSRQRRHPPPPLRFPPKTLPPRHHRLLDQRRPRPPLLRRFQSHHRPPSRPRPRH